MNEPEELHIIQTDAEIDTLIAYLEDKEYVAYDTETDGLSLEANVIGISVAAEIDKAWYVITAIWDPIAKRLNKLNNRTKVIQLLVTLQSKQLVTQNGLVDWNWTFVNYGVQLKDSTFHDTMLSSHLLNENRPSHALKERAYMEFGADATKEQAEMTASVIANGGVWETKRGGRKDMYMADSYIMGKYGAKDAILTLKLFYLDVPKLFEQNLDKFFYDDECMPLFRGPTYDLNTVGLKVDVVALKALEYDLKKEIDELKIKVYSDIEPYIKDAYPGTNKNNTFNIGSTKQLAWLLFIKLGNDWKKLTKSGKTLSKDLIGRIPYSISMKQMFVSTLNKSQNEKGKPYKLENYIQCDKIAIGNFSNKYAWCKNLLAYARAKKMLNTFVEGIQEKIEYGIVHPSFLQIGTKGPRYSSRNPNFQQLPRDDKRIKNCIIPRAGKVFVGADASQIEARVFASFSGDYELMQCFAKGEDFYSVIGMRVFGKTDCVPFKEGNPEAFGVKYKKLRKISKEISLAICYGADAPRLSDILNCPMEKAQQIIYDYWESYPTLKEFVVKQHTQAVETGIVYNLYGRPRRLPEARQLKHVGWPKEKKIPADLKTYLNMAVNAPIQFTAGSIINRAAIALHKACNDEGIQAPLVLQCHDQLVVETDQENGPKVAKLMQRCMEETCALPGVKLEAVPNIGNNLGAV